MKRQDFLLWMRLCSILIVFLSAPLFGAEPRGSAPAVNIYAAASLKNALDALIQNPQSASLGPIKVVYAASSTLARQIERGAPAGIFISADNDWMNYLVDRHLIKRSSRVKLLTNRLVLIARQDSPLRVATSPTMGLPGLLGKGRLAIADPQSVPAGKYARAALTQLGLWVAVSTRLAPCEDVRCALAWVARGEAPLGLVYASDALVEPRVRVLTPLPAHTHPPIEYPAALIEGHATDSAQAWLQFLQSAPAQRQWQHFGFGLPVGETP